ncbi:oligoendopeptidase F [Phascolarctobacterium sp.]|uniref:oligoendopeptidase F n=2 Tax=Phascolarctobacterium sp. TaxID=2049039 RepID=UPI00386F4507
METKNINIPAHGSNVLRADIPAEYKWHVQDIYADEAAWQAACAEFKALLPQLEALKGSITSAQGLYNALHLQDKMSQMLDKLYAYPRLQQDADNTDQHLQAIAGEAEALAAAFSSANSFIEPEMLGLGKEKVAAMLAELPELAEYKFYVENLLRITDHILSADKEAIFAQSRLATGTAASAFRSLVSADMEFPPITDGEGKPAIVSEGNYMLNMTSPDRELRKNSFRGLMGTYHKYRNTLATTLTGSARTAYFYASVHNYKDTLESCLAEDNIPTSLYDGLIQTVHDNFAPLHEYIQLKKDVLGYDEFHPYDLYMPLSKAADSFACTFPEACAKVEEALAPLGEDYIATLHKGLTEGWIDIYENKGKRSGAYSWGVYGVHPFVLLNYQQRYSSISTLAHEMGHALHSYYSSMNQTYVNSEYTIFCAEVASTTNENLLLEYTLQRANDEQKIYLLNQFLEAVRTTVYRQVQFAEFEKFIHGEITAGRSLQAEKLENYWLESNRQYYGPALTVDQELASEWSRIPHFYTPFYVYKYATGYSAATAFSSAILSGAPDAVEKYLGFLKAGGSDYSLNILKNAGVDLNTPQPVTVTLQKFATKLQELKKLLKK